MGRRSWSRKGSPPPLAATTLRTLAATTLRTLGVCVVTAAMGCGSPTGSTGTTSVDSLACEKDFPDPATSEYTLPFPEGRTYTMFQGFCPPNPNWGHQGWYAYDFDLATGDTVVASRAGRVLFVEEEQADIGGDCSGGKENLVYVEHADGTVMSYVHLTTNGALVDQDEIVEQGQPVGLSGNSGCSSGPHLHVTLFRAGGDFGRTASMPLNYRNAIGPSSPEGGLVQGATYTAGSIPTTHRTIQPVPGASPGLSTRLPSSEEVR